MQTRNVRDKTMTCKDQVRNKPRWVHSVHRVVPMEREPSADLAAAVLFLHRSVLL